jgi:selenocysteine lyase/cysteine desulfurase
MDGRVPTFAFAVEFRSPRAAAVFRMVQAGIVHYSTSEEVDRPLSALADL